MEKKLDVKQVYKDHKGQIDTVMTMDGKTYSDDQAINMVEGEVPEVEAQGRSGRHNYANLVRQGITLGAKVDDQIKKEAEENE